MNEETPTESLSKFCERLEAAEKRVGEINDLSRKYAQLLLVISFPMGTRTPVRCPLRLKLDENHVPHVCVMDPYFLECVAYIPEKDFMSRFHNKDIPNLSLSFSSDKFFRCDVISSSLYDLSSPMGG